MKALRITVHGLGLAIIILVAVLPGFAFYVMVHPVSQRVAQTTIAVAASIAGFAVWDRLSVACVGDQARFTRLEACGSLSAGVALEPTGLCALALPGRGDPIALR